MAGHESALRVFRGEHAPVFAALWRRLGEFDLVEAAMADAYLAAMASWEASGVPQNPASWIATVAMSATTSVLARRGHEPEPPGSPAEDVQAMLATCCQPALGPTERMICVGRAVVGLMPAELAALLGLSDTVVHQRLEAAKKVLRQPRQGLHGMPADPTAHAERLALIRAAVDGLAAAPGREAAEVARLARARVDAAFA